MRIGVIGPGAVGATIAAWLAQAHDVVVAARTPLDGLRIETPEGVIAARPGVWLDPAEAEPVDWVLVATKTYQAEATAAWLARMVGTDTRVAILQNGVEHVARFAGVVPAERIVPAVVDIPAERSAPGQVRQRRMGSIAVPAGLDGEDFARLFAHAPILVETTADIRTALWTKLALNCAGAVDALTLQPAGIVDFAPAAEVMRMLVEECVAVGRAEGAELTDDMAERVLANYRAAPPDSINSLHADRAGGRPTEIDARNGVIVRLGARHGIATPANAILAALVEAVGR